MLMPKKRRTRRKVDRTAYFRWISIWRRCYSESCDDYIYYGAQGFTMCSDWLRGNPDAFKKFEQWYYAQLALQDDKTRTNVSLLPGQKEYGPDTCQLMTWNEVIQKSSNTVLSNEQVIALRQAKKADPALSWRALKEKFGLPVTIVAIAAAVRGKSFKNLNEKEAPYNALEGLWSPITLD